jgi:hypothetical protein
MSRPITVKSWIYPSGGHYENVEYTYDQIGKIFGNEKCLAIQLLNRVEELEQHLRDFWTLETVDLAMMWEMETAKLLGEDLDDLVSQGEEKIEEWKQEEE